MRRSLLIGHIKHAIHYWHWRWHWPTSLIPNNNPANSSIQTLRINTPNSNSPATSRIRPLRFENSFPVSLALLSSGSLRPALAIPNPIQFRSILLRRRPSTMAEKIPIGGSLYESVRCFGLRVNISTTATARSKGKGPRPWGKRISKDHRRKPEVFPDGYNGDLWRSSDYERGGTGSMKGKLLTTPSRLFKLIIPLNSLRREDHRKEPIAILLHPQQPLSYLGRAIQSEILPIKGEDRRWRAPTVSFIAPQLDDNSIRPKETATDRHRATVPIEDESKKPKNNTSKPNGDSEERKRLPSHKESKATNNYILQKPSGEPTTTTSEDQFVRWSLSTEIGDFVRDAARAREFIVTIEGVPASLGQIHITVPSFSERTYFLRMRLRKISQRLKNTAEVKHECDVLAQRGGQRVAISGLFVLAVWWYFVYIMTFRTNLGWDTMEPVTYLVSLSSLMGGYLWFLYHNREISYKSALDFTVSARQKRLYQSRGVDLQLWETLLDGGKALRKEIKTIAAEYDVDWNERADEQDEQVTQALRKKTHHETDVGQESEDKEDNNNNNNNNSSEDR